MFLVLPCKSNIYIYQKRKQAHSLHSKITEDDEFGLFTVTVFQRVADEFCHKAREERFIPRDFKYDEDALQTQQRELEETIQTEREQHAELLRLAKTNFGEVFASWLHLKALRVFVESVLRYGLPPDFCSVTICVSAFMIDHVASNPLLCV